MHLVKPAVLGQVPISQKAAEAIAASPSAHWLGRLPRKVKHNMMIDDLMNARGLPCSSIRL